MRRLHVDLRAWAGLSWVVTGTDNKGWSRFREMVFACGDDWMQSQPQVLSVCISLKLEATTLGGLKPTFRLSNESEQIPYVLKQGSPDMSCVVMTTCKRKDKNNYQGFTDSCKYFYIWGSRKAFPQAQTCTKPTVINIQLLRPQREMSGWAQEVVVGLNYLQHHADSTKTLYNPQQCFRLLKCHTFRMELSCRVFLVSYPSRRHRRVVLPDPANSDRFKSAKPSCRTQDSLKHLVEI